MEIKEFGHLVLNVKDLDRSVQFYRDLLGFKEVARLGGGGVMFSGGRTHHELLIHQTDGAEEPAQAGRRPLGLSHFALKIGTTDDELRAAIEQLSAAGIEDFHTRDHGATHSVYLHDPDGNRVELYIDVQPETWRDNPALVGTTGPLAL
jgi:catechol-2,3-dioxygenase